MIKGYKTSIDYIKLKEYLNAGIAVIGQSDSWNYGEDENLYPEERSEDHIQHFRETVTVYYSKGYYVCSADDSKTNAYFQTYSDKYDDFIKKCEENHLEYIIPTDIKL